MRLCKSRDIVGEKTGFCWDMGRVVVGVDVRRRATKERRELWEGSKILYCIFGVEV